MGQDAVTETATAGTSRNAKLAGLAAAALAAWAMFTTVDLAVIPLAAMRGEGFGQQAQVLFKLYAMIGIPMALIVTIGLGYPTWSIAERRGWGSWSRAILVGLAVGAAWALVLSLGSELLGGAMAMSGTTSSSQQGSHTVTVNGLFTAYGWMLQALYMLKTSIVGGVSGLVAWQTAQSLRPRIPPPDPRGT